MVRDHLERIVGQVGAAGLARGSADQLKIMIGVAAFLMMAMAGRAARRSSSTRRTWRT